MIRGSQPALKNFRRLGFSVLAVIILLTAILSPPAYAQQGTITAGVVNVRSGPGSSNEVIGSLLKDTQVELLETNGGWNKIKYSNITGWVASEYISAAGQTSTPAKTVTAAASSKQVQVINGPISSRSGPGSNYPKSDNLPDKAVYKVLSEKDGWYQIQLSNGSSAYVAGWLVQETGTQAAAAQTTPAQTQTTAAAPSVAPNAAIASAAVKSTGSNASPSVILNQKAMQFEVPPRIENGRTLVPLRAIFEAMGASVDWNQATRTVTAQRGSTKVVLTLGSTAPTVNGQPYTLEVPAKIVNDRTLAPLRFVGEAFGGQVNWDAATRTINITYTPASTPSAVTIKEAQVNLREAPSTASAKVDIALAGERLTVLAEKDGWYQVSRNGITAWVASWVVEAAADTTVPVTPPTQTDPVTPVTEPTTQPTTPAANEPENVLHLARTRDASGIKVTISSKLKMEPKVKESSGSVQYEFTDRPLVGLNYFEENMGGETLKVKAATQDKNTIITVTLPSDVEYKMSTEGDGTQLVFFIPNYITGIESSAFGSVGERFIISTICPVTPGGNMTSGNLAVTLPGLRIKKSSNFSYSSNLISSVKVENTSTDVLMTFNLQDDCKFNFANSGSNNDLNVIIMRKIISQQPRQRLVVLDAGHGGRDTGARGSMIDEKAVNLSVALKAGELLKQKGIPVQYTRSDDSFVELEEISNIANRLNAEVFVSIHCNSNTSPTPSGTETYFYAPLSNPDLFVQRDERSRLATLLQNQLNSKLQRTNRGVKEGNLSVLRNSKMPSALVEMAFISNSDEQNLLMSDDFQNRAAQAIADAVEEYINSAGN